MANDDKDFDIKKYLSSYAPFGIGASVLGGLLNKDISSAGMPYLNQIAPELEKYFSPYINAGTSVLPQLGSTYSSLVSNPESIFNRIGSSYQQSPGFQFALSKALQAANQSAAAGGMAGSPQVQNQAMGIATQMGNQDYYNYMSHVLNLFGSGLSGLQDFSQMGLDASKGLGEDLASVLGSQAKLASTGAQQQNDLFGGMLGTAASLIPFL